MSKKLKDYLKPTKEERESMVLEILSEEKLAGVTVQGQFIYLNPTRDELLRTCYSSAQAETESKGSRALYFPQSSHKEARIYLFVIDVLHNMVQDVLEEAGIEDREHINQCTHVSAMFTDIYGDKAWIDRNHSPETIKTMKRLLHLSPKAELRVY